MRRLLLLLILLTKIIVTEAQVKETVLEEQFNNNSNGWPEDINDTYSASVNSGTYYLEHFRTKGSKSFDIPTKLDVSNNYFIETRGKIVSGDKYNGYGIVWGKGKNGFLSFVITGDSKFYVRRIHQGVAGEYLIDPKTSKYIKPIGHENLIRVQYSEGLFNFFINGKYVAHIPMEKYFGDNVGIILYGKQKVEIYNYGVYGTKNYELIPDYKAKLCVAYYEINDDADKQGNRMGNADCKIEPGETIQLAVTIKNQSYGTHKNLRATFYPLSDYVKVLNNDKVQILTNVERYSTQILDLKFRVNSACNLSNLRFKIDITDEKGRLGESTTFIVPMRTKIPPINKEDAGRISFSFYFKEKNVEDINTYFPITLNNSQNTCAVIIGVESYLKLPKATYATNDAKIFYKYLVKVINVKPQNIIYVTNQNATYQRIKNLFGVGGELYNRMAGNYDNLIIYFSGLGMCSNAKTTPYIMLYNSEVTSPQTTGYSVSQLLQKIKEMNARSVMCFFETSFSGLDRNGKTFVDHGGTVWSNASFPMITDQNICMMYASGGQQYNPLMETSSHGMFTHFLLSAMQQFAKNRETLNMKSLYDYIFQCMDREAMKHNISVFPRIDCVNKDGLIILK